MSSNNYLITINLFQTSVNLQMAGDATISELYSFLYDQFENNFKDPNAKKLKLYIPTKKQYLDNNNATFESILGEIYNCNFELKEPTLGEISNDFVQSNSIPPVQNQAQQVQMTNNPQFQNVQPQRNQFNQGYTQQQQVGQNPQNPFQSQNPNQQIQFFQQPQLPSNIQSQYNIPQVLNQGQYQFSTQNQFPQQNQNQFQYQNQNQFPQQNQNQFPLQNQNQFPQLNNQQQFNTLPNQNLQVNNQQQQNPRQLQITMKYKNQETILEVDSDLTLSELSAYFYELFNIDGQIEIVCGGIVLSQMNQNLMQAGIKDNSILECRSKNSLQTLPQGQQDNFYQQMRFVEVPTNQSIPPQNVNQTIAQQIPQNANQTIPQQYPQNVNQPIQQGIQSQNPQQIPNMNQMNPTEIDIKFEIVDGAISRSFSMRGSIHLTFNQLIEAVLTYLGCTREIADIDLFTEKFSIQGGKLQCTLQMLQMVESPLTLKAKVRYCGGQLN